MYRSLFNVNTGSANNRRRQEHADNDSEDVEKLDGVDRFDETQLPPGELAQLQEENALLFNELNSLVSEVRYAFDCLAYSSYHYSCSETEKRVLEISRLEAILETQVAKQSKEVVFFFFGCSLLFLNVNAYDRSRLSMTRL